MEALKVKHLLDKAEAEVKTEKEEQIIGSIKTSLKAIEDCKKTLRKLEKTHDEFLEMDIKELETDGWQY